MRGRTENLWALAYTYIAHTEADGATCPIGRVLHETNFTIEVGAERRLGSVQHIGADGPNLLVWGM